MENKAKKPLDTEKLMEENKRLRLELKEMRMELQRKHNQMHIMAMRVAEANKKIYGDIIF